MKILNTVLMVSFMVGAVAVSASADDFIYDAVNTEVICSDERNWRDAGLFISVESGGFTGMTLARMGEQTISGPREIQAVVVDKERVKDRGEIVSYVGEKFRLHIAMDSRNEEGLYLAKLKTQVEGALVTERMICRVY